MDIFGDAVAQLRDILLHAVHKELDVPLQLLRREAQLPDGHPDNAQPLSVLGPADHLLDGSAGILDDGARLHAGQEALGTEDAAEAGLVHLLQRVGVAQTAVEVDAALLDGLEHLILADHRRARRQRRLPLLAVARRDHADAQVRLDRVRQP